MTRMGTLDDLTPAQRDAIAGDLVDVYPRAAGERGTAHPTTGTRAKPVEPHNAAELLRAEYRRGAGVDLALGHPDPDTLD